MNVNSKKLGVYLGVAAALGAACVTLRTVACLSDLNYYYGYFNNKQLINIADVLLWCSVIFMLTYPVTAVRTRLRPSFAGPATYIATGAVGAALIFFARSLIDLAIDKSQAAPDTTPAIIVPTAVLTAVFAIFSAGHFAANAFFSEAKVRVRATLSIFTLLMLSCYAALLYFDNATPINAPNKLCDQMAFLFSALFFLYETRISLGREKWRAYATFGLMAFMLTAYSSLPSLITYFVRGATVSASIEENVLTLTLMLFIGARLLLTVFLPEEKENRTVSVLREAAEQRRAEVLLTETRFAEEYAVQMTFDEIIDHDIALELEDEYSTDDAPVSEAESPIDSEAPETLFDEGVLIDEDSDGQISLGYELLTPGESEDEDEGVGEDPREE